jgi:translocation and assembly module TamB
MSRRRAILIGLLALLVLVPAALVHRLLYTREGLEWLLSALERIESVHIEVSGANGMLAGPLSFDRVVVDHEAVRVEADGVRATLGVRGLLAGQLLLEDASIDRVEVTLKERPPQPESPTHFLPAWLGIRAPGASLRQVGVRLANGERLHAALVRGDLRMTRWRIDVAPLVLEDAAGRIDGKVFLRATEPLGLRSSLAGRWQGPDDRLYRFAVHSQGRLDRLAVDVTLAAPAKLSFSGQVLHLDAAAPRVVGTLRAADFDGSPWIDAGRLPRFGGSVAVDAGASGIGIDGAVSSSALADEPLLVHGSARYAASTLHVVSLRAWLPRQGASLTTKGSVTFAGEAPAIDLALAWQVLHWPLTGEPSFTSPSGALRVRGSMPYRFELQARASAQHVPEGTLSAAGAIDREQLRIDSLDARLIGGRVTGTGRLDFTGAQAWQAGLDGRALDLSALRPDLHGRVDVAGEFSGRGLSTTAPWTARVTRLSGSVNGRALTGSGEVAYHDGSYELRRVRVANAGSHVEVDGRYGATLDLRWSAEIETLSLLVPSLSGALTSSGTLRGPKLRPDARGNVAVHALHAADLEAGSARVDFDVDLEDRRDSRLDVRASGVVAGGLRFDSMSLTAAGRAAGHRLDARLSSPGSADGRVPGFEATLAAAGRYDTAQRSWSGTLEQASFDFPDGKATLAQPVDIVAGPSSASLGPLCLTTADARLCAEGEWHQKPASWRVLYSAEDWPLKRLLTSLLGRREFDGLLQLSGWAEQQPGHDWVGGAALVLERPTVDIRRNRFRSDRTEIGGGRVDVYAAEDAIHATATFDLAAGTQVQGEATAERERGRPLAASPVSGRIRAESSVLTALPLFVPEIDHSEGKLDAAVRLGGTLGNPQFTGDLHLRDGRLDLYRTNLSLTAASIDAHFAGDSLTFDGQATARKGAVRLSGHFTWPDGIMTGSLRLTGEDLLVADTPDYRVQASPDLTVTAGPGGFKVTGQVTIPFARISPRDLSASVNASPDEKIVGEAEPEAAAGNARRVAMAVRVKLGDDVRVDTSGLKAHLAGEVLVTAEPGEEALGSGAIRVLEGEYRAFGVYVKIVKGVLSYDRSPLDRPVVDLVAQREIKDENVTVSVNVRGTLNRPFVTLSSEPAMPSNEALSYLLTGRSIDTLQSAEASNVNRAAESLAVSGGGLLLGGIGTRLGLDEVSVSGSTSTDTEVVLGKFISPKLFVSYGVSVAEAINTIKARYTLNSRWALKAEAGLEQSADVEFKIER